MVRLGPDSVLRHDHLTRSLARLPEDGLDEAAVLEAMRSHRGGVGAVCCHPAEGALFGDRWVTLVTVTVEPAARSMTLRRGGPCQADHASTTAAAARQSSSRQGSAAS
jgi:hypothetical protein